MRFDLVDLQLFIAVADSRSITAGASRAHLALASASARIKGLEAALGVALLKRGRRGVELTATCDRAGSCREALRAVHADRDDQYPRPLGKPQTGDLRPQLQHAAASGEATGGASAQGRAVVSSEPKLVMPGLAAFAKATAA